MQSHEYQLNTLSTFNHITERAKKDLTHSEFRVLMNIFKHRNSVSYACFPGFALLADECRCSKGTITKAVNSLVEKKYIVACKRWNQYDSRAKSTQYWFCFELDTIHAAFNDIDTESFFESHYPDVYEWYHETKWK